MTRLAIPPARVDIHWRCPHAGCPGHYHQQASDPALNAPPVCGRAHGHGKGPAVMRATT